MSKINVRLRGGWVKVRAKDSIAAISKVYVTVRYRLKTKAWLHLLLGLLLVLRLV